MLSTKYRDYYILFAGIVSAVFAWVLVQNFMPQQYSNLIFADAGNYEFTFDDMMHEGQMRGFTEPWVYPYMAWLPIGLTKVLSFYTQNYILTWLLVGAGFQFAALYLLKKYQPHIVTVSLVSAWSFVNAALLAVGIFRLDVIAVSMCVAALAIFKKYPKTAYTILWIAAFIKIWPAAVIIGIWLGSNQKAKMMLWNIANLASIVLLPLAFGANLTSVLSFITQQSGRGVQIESLFAVPYLFNDDSIYFDDPLETYQIRTELISPLLGSLYSYLMFAFIIVTIIALLIKTRFKPTLNQGLLFSTIVLLAFISLNKVGSPQYMDWVIPVVVVFALINFKLYKVETILLLSSTLLTGLLAPLLYQQLLDQTPIGIGLLAFKHLLLLTVLIMLTVKLFRNQDNRDGFSDNKHWVKVNPQEYNSQSLISK